jgi:hypothetical protein
MKFLNPEKERKKGHKNNLLEIPREAERKEFFTV